MQYPSPAKNYNKRKKIDAISSQNKPALYISFTTGSCKRVCCVCYTHLTSMKSQADSRQKHTVTVHNQLLYMNVY